MLPCFEFMWYTISFLNAAGVVLFAVSFGLTASKRIPAANGGFTRNRLDLDLNAPYPCDLVVIPFTWMLQLLPFLMAQHSVSHEAVRRAIVYSGVICLCIIVLQITLFKEGHVAMGAISVGVHVMLLSFYCWAKFLSHARSSFDFFFVVAILDSLTAITVEVVAMGSSNYSSSSPHMVGRCFVMSLDAILTVAMLLSLRADTQYWLGIDDSNASSRHPFKRYMRHLSERGMITNFSTRTSVYDVHRMIEEHRNCVVDFSALKLECVIAQGATSIVMRGLMRSKPIALKIYTSVQVTDEEVRRFSRETALNVQLSHPNIVKFHGLCVVPPSISLVFEFCEYGGLDGVLGNGSMHSLSTKLRAWLDACRAVAYLHSFSPPLLHRDIKTDNFLVGQDFTLKLADFGEANLLKPRTDGTMTIAGTVDYMAPEMILGGKTARYGTGVDVYSLMITLWQIMVPDRSPWEGRSHLEVYTCVANGERPPLLPSIPSGCAEILEAGWVANPSERVAVEDIIAKVHQLWLLSTHQKTLKRTK
jgi:serine/threonine protein kinase